MPATSFASPRRLRADYYQIPYDPDPTSWQNQLYDSSGLRDGQHETDAYAILSWIHTFSESTMLQVSPFYHFNRARYEPHPDDFPNATTSDQTGNYAGMQASFTTTIAKNSISAGYMDTASMKPTSSPCDSTTAAIPTFPRTRTSPEASKKPSSKTNTSPHHGSR